MLKYMFIDDFRVLQNIPITMGQQITIIAGQNGTGKSTILSIIAHSSEVKDKNIFGRPYRSQFSEMIKQSYKSDTKNNECVHFELCAPNDFTKTTERFHYRRYWVGVNEDGSPIGNKRPTLKLLPVRTDRKKKDSKIEVPVIYLGLSRLYPVGEAGLKSNDNSYLTLSPEEKEYLVSNHLSIMSLRHIFREAVNVEPIELRGVRKKTSGLETSFVDATGNSAGQDNVTQVLLALLSFKRLKADYEAKHKPWDGGFLLIDEFDATLHAKSQILLFDHLLKEAKDLQIQVVLTTHSMFFLEYIYTNYTKKGSTDESSPNQPVELYYLDNSSGIVKCHRNLDFKEMRNYLMVDFIEQEYEPIPVLAEDEEAKFLFKKLIPNWNKVFRFVPLTSSDGQMKNLIQDPYITENWLIVHDSDVQYNADDLERSGLFKVFRDSYNQPIIPANINVADNSNNIVFLPNESTLRQSENSRVRPERNILNFIREISNHGASSGFFLQYPEYSPQFLFSDPDIMMPQDKYNKNDRKIDKDWFRKLQEKYPRFLDLIIDYWIQTHEDACQEFRNYVYLKTLKLKKLNHTPIPVRYIENLLSASMAK